jgi:hypothetical protein
MIAQRFELLISFTIVLILWVGYAVYAWLTGLSSGHPVGPGLGWLGLLLMLMTETIYTFRKRVRRFRFGQLQLWLSFHIITGIVGPWVALLHTGFSFRGLAGLAMVLTVLVVISGFIGRYIYTAVPRTMAGTVASRKELLAQMAKLQRELEHWLTTQPDTVRTLITPYYLTTSLPEVTDLALLTRFWNSWHAKRQRQRLLHLLTFSEQQKVAELEAFLRRRQELDWQIASLKTAQRLLRLWHQIHVPLGLTLFTTIAIHIGAVIYFGAL